MENKNLVWIIIILLIVVVFIGGYAIKKLRPGPEPSPEPQPPPTPEPPTTGEFGAPFNLFSNINLRTSEQDLRFAAENSRVISFAYIYAPNYATSEEKLQFLKNINPEVYLSIYHSLGEIKRTDPLLLNGTFDEHEEWFLHCKNNPSERVIFSPERYRNYFVDVSNEEYRDFWIERSRRAIKEDLPIIDILYIDIAFAKQPMSHFSCEPEKYSDDWLEREVGEFLQEIKSAFPDKMVVSNSIKAAYSDDWESFGGKYTGVQYANYVDGVSAEAWVHIWGVYRGEEFWRTMLNAYISVLKRGKWLAIVQHPEKFDHDDQRRMFGFASALLINSEDFGFNEQILPVGEKQVQKHPIFYIPLGEPKEGLKSSVESYLDKGVYKRDYENGLILVNPSETKTKTYSLGRTMNNVVLKGDKIEYQTTNEVTLPPVSGAILISQV